MKNILRRIRILMHYLIEKSKPASTAPYLITNAMQISAKGVHSYHNGDFVVKGKGGVLEIGSYCAIGHNVKVIVGNHFYDYPVLQYAFYENYFKEYPYTIDKTKTIIENDVWIGDNVVILPGVKVGTGAILGAGAIVTKDVPPYAIVGGNPAKIIKYRFKIETIQQLLDSKWWEWDEMKIKENKHFFFNTLD